MSARVPAAADSIRAVLSDQIELEEDEFVVLLTENWELVSAELNTRNVRSQVTVRVILHQIRKFGGRHHQDLSDDFVPPVVDGGDGDPFRLSAVLNDLPGHCWVGSSDDMALHVCVLCLALCRITGSAAPWVTQDEMRGVTSLRRLIVANYAPPRVLAQARVALAGWLLYRAKMSKLKRGLASIPTLPPRGDLLRSIVDKAALRKSPNTTTTTNTNTSTSSPTSTPTKPTTPTTPSTTTTMQSSTLASSTLTRSGTVTSSSTTTAPRPRSPPTVTPTSSLRPTTTPTASSTETNSSTLLYPVFSPAKSSCATTAEPTFESGTLKNTVGPKPVVEVDHSDTAVALLYRAVLCAGSSTKFNDEMVWPELADAHYILALCWRMGVGVPFVDKARSRFHTSMAAMISELAPPDQTRVVGGISFSISALSPNRGAVSSMPINAPWQNPNSSKVTILASQVEPTSDKVLALVVMFLQDDKESLLKLRLCNKSLCRIATWVLLSKRTPIPQPLPPVVASSSTLEMLPLHVLETIDEYLPFSAQCSLLCTCKRFYAFYTHKRDFMIARACKQIRNIQNLNNMLSVVNTPTTMNNGAVNVLMDFIGGLSGEAIMVLICLLAAPAWGIVGGPIEGYEVLYPVQVVGGLAFYSVILGIIPIFAAGCGLYGAWNGLVSWLQPRPLSVGEKKKEVLSGIWEKNAASCRGCGSAFGIFSNRCHHCRFCLLTFCSVCSDQTYDGERVCKHCHFFLQRGIPPVLFLPSTPSPPSHPDPDDFTHP